MSFRFAITFRKHFKPDLNERFFSKVQMFDVDCLTPNQSKYSTTPDLINLQYFIKPILRYWAYMCSFHSYELALCRTLQFPVKTVWKFVCVKNVLYRTTCPSIVLTCAQILIKIEPYYIVLYSQIRKSLSLN